MARIKQTSRKAQPWKPPQKPISSKDNASSKRTVLPDGGLKQTFQNVEPKRKRRNKAGTVAMRRVKQYQRSTALLALKLPFKRLVQQKAESLGFSELRCERKAMYVIQEASEAYLVDLYKDANLSCLSGDDKRTRTTVNSHDIDLVRVIRKEI
jgi:histone H3/H4